MAGFGLILTGHATAQTFTNLYSFTGGSDGAYPFAGLVLSGNTLYGTTVRGGIGGFSGSGTVFALNTNGTGFTNLYSFTGGGDGADPSAGLILSGNILYGTAEDGGIGGFNGNGTVFALNTDGTGFTNLYSFTGGSDGANPAAGLVLSGNTLYGTAQRGGTNANGTVFALNINGSNFTTLHTFTGYISYPTNDDGIFPQAGLILSGNTLYGTAGLGGTYGGGTVFAVNTDGTGFTTLHAFTADVSGNNDGADPSAGLILSGNTLFGTAGFGGNPDDDGTVFAVTTDGTGFTTLHTFSADVSGNSDGAAPFAGLVLSGNTLFGTAQFGGNPDNGTVFAVNTDGTGFTNLHAFTSNPDGAGPFAGLVLSGNTLYGTAYSGGTNDNGAVFALSLVPSLGIATAGSQVVLSWPTWAPNFGLLTTANLASPVWNSVFPAPVSVNGQNIVTNPISNIQQFYRLVQYLTPPPAGMALIPAGSFTIGNYLLIGNSTTNDPDIIDAKPTNVYVSAFYMDVNLVSYSQWQSVYNWATNHGYGFVYAGSGKAANHPVQTVDWYDCVKWCNARSQQAGLTPAYYTDAALTQVYTNGEVDIANSNVNWTANGYRLPTEAEWEKAARGGLIGQRFPWGNIISETNANYFGHPSVYSYDLGPFGNNTNSVAGGFPYTSPVGYFAPNGYGLYDMAGNVIEWCWDWYAPPPYPAGSPYLAWTDPHGPIFYPYNIRILRGGSGGNEANQARCAYRYWVSIGPTDNSDFFGFRSVRGR